jgi:cbb3-type cytochrome oxidase subunit 3
VVVNSAITIEMFIVFVVVVVFLFEYPLSGM